MSNNYQELKKIIYDKLVEVNLIMPSDKLRIRRIHKKHESNGIIYHYIISVNNKRTFLLRTVKEHDYSYLVMDYLTKINNKFPKPCFPNAVIPPFNLDSYTYILTSYLEGKDLGKAIYWLSNEQLVKIADILNEKLDCLHRVTAPKYSDGYNFSSESPFAEIMFNKIKSKLAKEHCINIFMLNINKEKLLNRINTILSESTYSEPTLIHLDIKPANIIIMPDIEDVCLIDFELSRFSDIDYEWTNLLLKNKLNYSVRFKKYILEPILIKNFMPLSEALKINKYKVYILYHSINNYIYYFKHNMKCPEGVITLIEQLIKDLSH